MSIEQALYVDLQAEAAAGFCSRCGGCLYRPTLHCIRCERRGCREPGGAE